MYNMTNFKGGTPCSDTHLVKEVPLDVAAEHSKIIKAAKPEMEYVSASLFASERHQSVSVDLDGTQLRK